MGTSASEQRPEPWSFCQGPLDGAVGTWLVVSIEAPPPPPPRRPLRDRPAPGADWPGMVGCCRAAPAPGGPWLFLQLLPYVQVPFWKYLHMGG